MSRSHRSNKLRELRLSKGVSQIELAVQASTCVSTVWMLEHGKGNVSRRKKIKVASALGLEVGQVFPEEADDD